MKKFLITLALFGTALGLSGCGQASRVTAKFTGYNKTCVDGVSYIQFPSGATVQYDRTGKIVTC